MFYQLSGAVSERLIDELRRFWMYHPKYADRLPENIQGRYSFKERPQCGIIVKSGGGSPMTLSADNYMGMTESYVLLTKYNNYPGTAVEWAMEDALAIQRNGGVFPSPPGIYYLDLVEEEEFVIDVLLDVYGEQVTQNTTTSFQLGAPAFAGSLRLYEQPSGWLLVEGTSYTVSSTGEITLATALDPSRWLQADYRTVGPTNQGPYPIFPNRANNTAIPGCVLAFGNRNKKGDRMAVVVQDFRHPAHLQYGGKWELSFDMDIFARDIYEAREISDMSSVQLIAIIRSRLSQEGIEIMTVSLGGEAEESYDDNADDYFYTCSISIQLQSDWAIFVPIFGFLRQAVPLTLDDIRRVGALPDDQLQGELGRIQALEGLNLEALTDPFFRGNATYETIR